MQRIAIATAVAVATGFTSMSAMAADSFPSKPVRMLVPYPPGGGLDLPGRVVSQKFAESTGQQLILDNRGGAGGLIAGEIVSKANPDGYTLLLGSNGQISIAPWLFPKMPYDPINDLVPVTHFVDTPMVLFVTSSYPVQNVKDLIAAAKAKPKQIGSALSGVGGVSHLTLELFKQRANVDLVGVPYRGAAVALGDVASGSVPLIFTTVSSGRGLLDTGRVRPLAVAAKNRTGSLPNVPSFEELGYTGMDAPLWIGMFAPKGTPKSVIDRLNAEFVKALRATDSKDKLAAQSADIIAAGPVEFGAMIKRDTDRWRDVIRTANIKIE